MSNPVKPVRALSTQFAALFLISPLLSAPGAAADAWPSRPVRFIVTLGPGSGVDIGARLFADKLSAKWGQPVVVENRPGGDGMVAITSFLGTRDDHTLLVSPVSSFTAHPYFHDKLPYDPKDLIPIARISKTVVAVSVATSLNVSSLKELEAGYPSLQFDGLVGLFGPPGIADDVRTKIADDIRAAAADPEIVKRLTATGQIVSPGNAAEFAASIAEQREQAAAVAKLFGNKPVQ